MTLTLTAAHAGRNGTPSARQERQVFLAALLDRFVPGIPALPGRGSASGEGGPGRGGPDGNGADLGGLG
jgi:hypothetical protein